MNRNGQVYIQLINQLFFICLESLFLINAKNKTGSELVVYFKYNADLATFKWRLDDRNTVFQSEMIAIR